MKAVIMAGGEGTRLRPVSILRPKPMVSYFDKPILEHIIELLKRNGIGDICVTLRYLPQVVTDYFGDGSEFGVNIEYRIEDEPLGTAGSVLACADFIGNEDFLVISGDAVCSFDLKKCFNFHREKRSSATIILCEKDEPLEYGLVLTDKNSRITQFVEKPSWDRVCTDEVNTGIYILSPDILKHIPEGMSYDFGRDLFPKLLNENIPIYAFTAEGYWCDIGSSRAYLSSIFDTLDGKTGIKIIKKLCDGVWANSRLPDSVKFYPPCYIGRGVTFGDGAELGPFAVVGSGSHIGSGVKIENAMVDGAEIGAESEIDGAIICHGAVIGGSCVVSEGCIVGENSIIGQGSFLSDGVLIWPDKRVESGSRVLNSVIRGTARSSAVLFEGRLSGELGTQLSFENLIDAGSSLARFEKVIVSSNGTPPAVAALNALKCGICAGGGEVWEGEAGFETAAGFGARHYGMGASAFVRDAGQSLSISFFGNNGRPFGRADERKIEASLNGDVVRAAYDRIGRVRSLPDTVDSYALAAVKQAFFREKSPIRTKAFVFGDSAAAQTLKHTLTVLGCTEAKNKDDGVCFQISDDGFTLIAEQDSEEVSPLQITVMLALLEFEIGSGRIAVLPSSPAAIDILAESLGGKVFRYGRDAEAENLLKEQAFVYDGVFAAARLIVGLAVKGETLSHLLGRIPKFFVSQRSVPVNKGKGAVMRGIMNSFAETSVELAAGLDIISQKGRVHISPRLSSDLRISAEAENAEAAEELCIEFENIIRKIDKKK